MLADFWSDIRYRLRAIFQRRALERELDDELRFHLDREVEKLVRSGVPVAEARRRARVAFGGLERIKDDSRDVRGTALLDILSQDLRYAWRGLRARPGFTAAVVLAFGLGIGANAAMFGIVDRLMFRPAPYLIDPGRVNRVYIQTNDRSRTITDFSIEYTRYLDFQRWTHSFDLMAGFRTAELAVGTGNDAREMSVAIVDATLFRFFDVQPVLGRFFAESEDQPPTGAAVVVLGHTFWQTRYGGRREVLGTPLRVGPVIYTIIGVAPEGFIGPTVGANPVAFIPATTYAAARPTKDPSNWYTKYNWGWIQVLARRKVGVTVDAATADLTDAYKRSYEVERAGRRGATPASIARPRAIAAPVQLSRGPAADSDARVIGWIGGVALIVLLIACANVANLMLARALRRRREIAVRLALGVSRGRLISQLCTESMLLAFLGGAAGVVIAQVGGRALRALFLASDPSLSVVGDPRTLVFAAIASIGCGLLTGLAPMMQAGRGDLAGSLKAGVREGTYHRSRMRSMLLVFQGTLSVVLLIGAGLFVRSLWNVRSMPLGYDVDPVLYVYGNMRGERMTAADTNALAERMLAAAREVPGVSLAARGLTVPFWDTWSTDLFVAGIDSVNRLGDFTLQAGSADYFATTGTRIVRGRGFTNADRAGAPLVAVVSESMAKRLWPGRNALGQCMKVDADTVPCTTIVGISEDIRQNSLTDEEGLHYYLPIDQFKPTSTTVFVRVVGDARPYAEAVRRRVQAVMPGAAYVTVTPMHDIIDPNRRSWYFGATMFLAFGALALVLAAIGLYSVIAHNVAQRTQELGVRIALGAQARHVLRLIVGEGLRFATIGIVVGIAIALAAGRWLAPMLFGVSPGDPTVYVVVGSTLLVVALAASAIPAARAARVDPNQALRAD